jgi:hypothetical protein
MYKYLPITELAVGQQMTGKYRGFMADSDEAGFRVFLETNVGPFAVACDTRLLNKLKVRNISEGQRITLTRLSETVYQVDLESP